MTGINWALVLSAASASEVRSVLETCWSAAKSSLHLFPFPSGEFIDPADIKAALKSIMNKRLVWGGADWFQSG